ncbi:MAG: SH3 domain-containing protein, partial [Campylobacterales bacterium]
MIEFDLGSINLTTLLDAHNDLTSAQKSAVQSSYDFLLSKYMILEGVGKLVDAIILNSPSYNQMRLNDVVKNDEGFDGAMKFDKDGLNRFKNSHTQFIPITLPKDSNQEEKISMESACYEVKATTLNVRKKPSLKSKTIGQKHRGEVVCSSKKDKNWVKIGDGQWVYDEYLVVQNESF